MKKVLIIEDEAAIRLNLLKILKYSGFEVVDAANGAIGVQLAEAHLPDLIICDVTMPEYTGHEVLTTLRQNPETAMIPFIFLTAKADRSDIRQGMNLGADDYLTKPFTSQELMEAVKARLDKQTSTIQPYVQEMQRVTQSLSQAAYTDPLTSLPNRILLRHKLQTLLKQAQQESQSVAVLCLNLDRFSQINAIYGSAVGDLILQTVAHRLTTSLGASHIIARLSGDEFGIVLVDVNSMEARQQAQAILSLVSKPYTFEDQHLLLHASLGITLFPHNSQQVDQLLTQADVACHLISQHGGNGYQFYTPAMKVAEQERQVIATELNLALERSQFRLYYQPQVNAITGRIVGLEALLRWYHPEKGMISPGIFIPIAESNNMIIPIGEWVLRTACLEAKTLQRHYLAPLRISVNLSARQFRQPNFTDRIIQIIQETEIDPQQLVLELTETSLMDDMDAVIISLHQLRDLGVEVSIDDFGTGYASLQYLRRLPVDVLKIDRSFVNQVNDSEHDAAIASSIIAMAQSLKLKVIAEGVETAGQLAFLRQHGCYLIQGFLYSPPLPLEKIQQLLSEDMQWNPTSKIL